jgi:hypothetical protein
MRPHDDEVQLPGARNLDDLLPGDAVDTGASCHCTCHRPPLVGSWSNNQAQVVESDQRAQLAWEDP